MKKIRKGEYGYRTSFKKKHIFLISVMAVFIIAQLAARYFTDSQAVKNILTVMAIVTVLPAANPGFSSGRHHQIQNSVKRVL